MLCDLDDLLVVDYEVVVFFGGLAQQNTGHLSSRSQVTEVVQLVSLTVVRCSYHIPVQGGVTVLKKYSCNITTIIIDDNNIEQKGAVKER